MKGYRVTYLGMFEGVGALPPVRAVRIPIIQRDYAQGREDADVADIRADFLEVLLGSLAGPGTVELDFVYGRMDDGVLQPLDGQQRLTTLFLLHWFIASGAGALDPSAPWTRFTYETRPGARMFCQRLVEHPLPTNAEKPSTWLRDQAWYLHQWRDDPTVQAMEVMLDTIDQMWRRRHADVEATTAWSRLSDTQDPAISFSLLPLDDMESDETLYVTMNSRGKPLTPFEHLKARLEQEIRHSPLASEIAHRFDGEWSDLFWPIHGGDDIVDDELMRYLDYVTEVCEMRDAAQGGLSPARAEEHRLVVRMRETFGAGNARSEEHLQFLVDAFDAWRGHANAEATLDTFFATAAPDDAAYDPKRARLFGSGTTDLLERCSHRYDSRKAQRDFSLQETLLMHAVLTHLRDSTPDPARRVRVLRNLAAASVDEIRRETLPMLLQDVEQFMQEGDLTAIQAFSTNQVADEIAKRAFLAENPHLEGVVCRLEDHDVLRGSLGAFDLDASTLPRRGEAFELAFSDPTHWALLTGALLATGDYFRRPRGRRSWQFGTGSPNNEGRWRYLLTNGSRDALAGTREVLGRFLDGVADSTSADAALSVAEHCDVVMADFIAECRATERLDWRYYLVAYPAMREGETGLYFSSTGELGYMLCMLRRTTLASLYRDPVLLEVWRRSGAGRAVEDPWFTGWETGPRWMTLVASGTGVQNVDEGFLLRRPQAKDLARTFDEAVAHLPGVEEAAGGALVRIPQRGGVDIQDRVTIGAQVLAALTASGL